MKVEGFKIVSYDSKKSEWLQGTPYAVLNFISNFGQVAHSHLPTFLGRYGVDDIQAARRLSVVIVEALLKGGNIYEIRDRLYAPLPPYAIQMDPMVWIILGDTRVDKRVIEDGSLLGVQSSVSEDDVHLERKFEACSKDALSTLMGAGIRPYRQEDVLDIIPQANSLVAPIPWPGFEPSAYAKWEIIDTRGRWIEARSRSDTPEGLCRGSALDEKGKAVYIKYFFRHRDGWGPVTSDEASLWVLRTAMHRGQPYAARYLVAPKTLRIPFRIPHAAYLALRFLGRTVTFDDGELVVSDIQRDIAEVICTKLAIELATRRF